MCMRFDSRRHITYVSGELIARGGGGGGGKPLSFVCVLRVRVCACVCASVCVRVRAPGMGPEINELVTRAVYSGLRIRRV